MRLRLVCVLVCVLLLGADDRTHGPIRVRREVPSPSRWELVRGLLGTDKASEARLVFGQDKQVEIGFAKRDGLGFSVGMSMTISYESDPETGLPVVEGWVFRNVGNQVELTQAAEGFVLAPGFERPVRLLFKRVK